MITLQPKTFGERLDSSIDFGPKLDGDTIVSVSLFTARGSMLINEKAHTESVVEFWVEGGTPGQYGDMVCRIQTRGDRIMDETVACFCYA